MLQNGLQTHLRYEEKVIANDRYNSNVYIKIVRQFQIQILIGWKPVKKLFFGASNISKFCQYILDTICRYAHSAFM